MDKHQQILNKLKKEIASTLRKPRFMIPNTLKNELDVYLKSLICNGMLIESSVKRTKLPRKLKKRYKKEGKICMDLNVVPIPVEHLEMTIQI